MNYRTLVTATIAGFVLSGAAFAQMQTETPGASMPSAQTPPAQMQGVPPATMAPTEQLGRQNMPDDQQATPMHRSGKGQPTASDSVPKDRFGKAIRGNTCAAHWANCAYDPANPQHQQLGAAPIDDGQRAPMDGSQQMPSPRTGF